MTFSFPDGPIRFGVFELDSASGELRKSGRLVRLKPQPLRLLTVLAAHPGRIVSREEIQKQLWPDGTFVDFEQGVNHCIREIRAALGDDADVPRYVETLPRRGYRFIAPVEPLGSPTLPAAIPGAAARTGRTRRWALRLAAGLAAVLLIAGVIVGRQRHSVPAPVGPVMLAVLPFENLSGDPAQEYLSDGLTEEMITQLGSLHPERLGVIARTSAMRYKHTRESVAAIGRQLGVDYILEGSVRENGDRVRVSAQLIKVRDQTHLWADSYERELSDVLAVQSEVARAIAGRIRLELTLQQDARLAEVRRVDREALEHYLKGRYYWNQRAPEPLRRAREHFEQALARDPAYAAAWAGLAECYVSLGVYEVLPLRESVPRAKEAARKALELDQTLGQAHATLATVFGEHDWDFPAAEREFTRAIELAPSDATAHQWYAEFLLWSSRFDEAESEMSRALELDPLSLVITRNQGLPDFFRRDYGPAREHFRRALELDPNFAGGHMLLGLATELAGDPEAAAASLEKAVTLDASPLLIAHLARSRARAGRPAEARRMLAELSELARRRYVAPFDLAMVHASLGDRDRAFACLEEAYREHSHQMVWLKVDPWWDDLRADPRFVDLVRRVGVPPQASGGRSRSPLSAEGSPVPVPN